MTDLLFASCSVNNMGLHVLPTKKFKTLTFIVNIQQHLNEEIVTKTALLPFVLRRGSVKYPTAMSLRQRLDELYGASIESGVFKRGERHVIQFRMDLVNEKYLTNTEGLLAQCLEVLGEVISNPVIDGGGFRKQYMESEKDLMRKRIESIMNDKVRYAMERCLESMCEGEPYRLSVYGQEKDLASIGSDDLYNHYRNILRNAPIDIFVVGDVDPESVEGAISSALGFERDTPVTLPPSIVNVEPKSVKHVVDRLDVKQGKLNIGYRVGTTYADDDYEALLVYNGVLGAFPHSKLFTNVREKASLCYYASSRLESHKGLMTIQSGIEIANYEKALGIINEQLESIKKGDISDKEMLQTRAVLTNQLREMSDRASDMIDFAYHSIISGRKRKLDDIISRIESVTVADVKRVASKVKLDTIYFLRDKQEEAK